MSDLTLTATETVISHQEHHSGNMNKVRDIRISGDVTLTANLFQIDKNNLAQVVRGTITDLPAGTVTSESLGNVAAGDVLILDNGFNVENLQVSDSSSAMIADTHYVFDARSGRIEFIDLPPAPAMPLTANYEHGAVSGVVLFNSTVQDIEILYEGINLAEGGKPVRLELYRVSVGALQNLTLIADDASALASMPWTAGVLADTSNPAAGPLGQVGRFLYATE